MLEKILIKHFDLDKSLKNWNESYSKLVELIYDLGNLGVLPPNERIVDELDKIHNEEE